MNTSIVKFDKDSYLDYSNQIVPIPKKDWSNFKNHFFQYRREFRQDVLLFVLNSYTGDLMQFRISPSIVRLLFAFIDRFDYNNYIDIRKNDLAVLEALDINPGIWRFYGLPFTYEVKHLGFDVIVDLSGKKRDSKVRFFDSLQILDQDLVWRGKLERLTKELVDSTVGKVDPELKPSKIFGPFSEVNDQGTFMEKVQHHSAMPTQLQHLLEGNVLESFIDTGQSFRSLSKSEEDLIEKYKTADEETKLKIRQQYDLI